MTTRLNVNINDETAEALRQLADRRQTTVTEIVRRAVSVYKFIEDEVVDGNKTLKLVTQEGQETSVSLVG
ncbi:ribbon-helix-helix protein, CopG family [Kribbella sp. NBC_00382]|uniref:ribbon-helix-helix protein, CopG family n=1 Tax=Kribbella sp. NBC_00382 TaxID=2975967 RepID=UPI002E23A879